MNPIPNQPDYDKWRKRADAMNRVADLAHEDGYIEFLDKMALRKRYHWESDETKIALESNAIKGELVQYLGSDRILVVDNLAAEATVARSGVGIVAELTINGRIFSIQGRNDELFLNVPNLDTPINISAQDLTEFMLVLAANYVDSGHGSPLKMMNEYDQATSDVHRLIAIIYGIGNINGRSSRTTWAAVKDDTSAFVARLTEMENPDSSYLNHTIQTIDSTELFYLEEGFDITQTNNPTTYGNAPRDEVEISYSGISPEDGISQFIGAALRRSSIKNLPGLSYRHSAGHGAEESREYADDCIRFLRLLDIIIPTQEQP